MEGSLSSNSSSSFAVRREVDYYLNPTELFRWINYRRWDGARARAASHPEECGTWIVSKNSDGGINWRHLPIHLVCMQCGKASGETLSQIEALLDALILSYPEGASVADSQGMLPLHLAVSHGASEKFLTSLVACYPNGAHTKDKFGRSPIDIVNNGPPGSRRDVTLQVLRRAKSNVDRMTGSIRKEAAAEVAAVTQSAANERVASQRIIMRLEEELASAKEAIEGMHRQGEGQSHREHEIEKKFKQSQLQCEKLMSDLETVREERDKVTEQMRPLRLQVENHNNDLSDFKSNVSADRNQQNKLISELRSELSTAKAMTDAVENQLRTRFSNEEEMSGKLSDLEASLNKSRVECASEKRKYLELKDQLESENEHLHKTVDDMTSRNNQMVARIGELNKQLNNLLSSYHSLNTEHERIMESTTRYEQEFLDSMQLERERIMKSISKQRIAFENSVTDQQRLMEEAHKKEKIMQVTALEERERANKVIQAIKAEFKAAANAERERKLKDASRFKPEKGVNRGRDNSVIGSLPEQSSRRSSSGKTKTKFSSSTPKSYNSRQYTSSFRESPSETTISSGPAPSGEGRLLRLLEDRAEGKLPTRYNRTSVGSRQMSFGGSTYEDPSHHDDGSFSFSNSSDSIGFSYNKQKVNILASRERYETSIDDRDEESNYELSEHRPY